MKKRCKNCKYYKQNIQKADNEFFNFDKVIEIEKNKSYEQGKEDTLTDVLLKVIEEYGLDFAHKFNYRVILELETDKENKNDNT